MKQFNIICSCISKRINKKYFVSLFMSVIILISGFFIFNIIKVSAEDFSESYTVTNGVDATDDTPTEFTTGDISRLDSSDDSRMATNAIWPNGVSDYDENKYLEFGFETNIPSNATIKSVHVINEYRNSTTTEIYHAKLEVWDGESYTNFPLDVNTTTDDITNNLDLTTTLNTPKKINNTNIKFLAYRDTNGQAKTSHDFIGLDVSYTITPIKYTEIGGEISEDTVLTKADSPYVVNDDIYVDPGVTLTIESGVILKFGYSNGLAVAGRLDAEGTESTPIYFTSSDDDSLGGDTNEDGDESLPYVGSWSGVIFLNSKDNASILNNIYINYSDSSIASQYTNLSVNNLNISNSINGLNIEGGEVEINGLSVFNIDDTVLNVFDGAEVTLKNANININNNDVINVFANSSLTIENAKVNNTNGYGMNIYLNSILDVNNLNINTGNVPISVFGNSKANIRNTDISSNNSDGIIIYDNSNLKLLSSNIFDSNSGIMAYGESNSSISDTTINGNDFGIMIFDGAIISVDNSKIQNSSTAGIFSFSNNLYDDVSVTKSEISNNETGLILNDSITNIIKNNIHDNKIGALTYKEDDIDLSNNFWGDTTGPYNKLNNPDGKGNEVDNHIIFDPFLKVDPLKDSKNPIIIIPGITGSYLYKDYDDKGEIWPDILKLMSPISIEDNFLNDLILNKDGTENPDFPIKVGDIIRNISTVHVFDNMISKLEENGYTEGENLFVFPYDWRLSTKHTAELLNEKVNEVLSTTGQEKVDLIAHSMGGLVAKKYIADYGENKIDQLIFLGTPQLGAPKAFKVLMFGDSMGFNKLFLGLNQQRAKYISQNMPAVYELLPSSKYIHENGNYVINAMDKNNILNLDYTDTKNFLVDNGRNELMFPFTEELHDSVDYMDLSKLKSYNFVGCKMNTIGKITLQQENSWLGKIFSKQEDYSIGYTSGDGTVPKVSADKTTGGDVYYALGVDHSALPDSESIINGIISILDNKGITFDDTLRDSDSQCKISGDVVSVHSPVELHIYDEEGNHVGPDINGDIEYGIPGVGYDVLDDVKYAFLPDGVNYKVVTKATDTGGYNFKIEKENNDEITSTYNWDLIPLDTLNAQGEIWIGPDYSPEEYKVQVDENGDGKIDQNYEEGFDGTLIAEKATKKDDNKEKTRNSVMSSGSIPQKDKNDNWGGHNFVDNVKIGKSQNSEENNYVENRDNYNNEGSKITVQSSENKTTNKEKDIFDRKSLLAQVGNINIKEDKYTIIGVILGGILVVLLAIKLIFKIK